MTKDLTMLKAVRDIYRARFDSLLTAKGPMNWDLFETAKNEYQEADDVYVSALLKLQVFQHNLLCLCRGGECNSVRVPSLLLSSSCKCSSTTCCACAAADEWTADEILQKAA